MASWRSGTTKQYQNYLDRWKKYCQEHKVDLFNPALKHPIEFLVSLYQAGLGYNANMKQEELCSALACQCPKSNPVNWIQCSAMDCRKWYHIHRVGYLEDDEKPEKWICKKEKCTEHGSFRYLLFLHSSRILHKYDEILCVTYMSIECRAGICPTTLP